MSKINGHGGALIKALDGNGPQATIHNSEYELDLEYVIDDVTDSGSGGVAQGLPCLAKVQSLTMSVAEDDSAYPELLGLRIGRVVDLWLKRGATNQFDFVSGTIVKGYRKVNDSNGKARRIMVTCEYGSYTHDVAPPPGFGG